MFLEMLPADCAYQTVCWRYPVHSFFVGEMSSPEFKDKVEYWALNQIRSFTVNLGRVITSFSREYIYIYINAEHFWALVSVHKFSWDFEIRVSVPSLLPVFPGYKVLAYIPGKGIIFQIHKDVFVAQDRIYTHSPLCHLSVSPPLSAADILTSHREPNPSVKQNKMCSIYCSQTLLGIVNWGVSVYGMFWCWSCSTLFYSLVPFPLVLWIHVEILLVLGIDIYFRSSHALG